MLFSVLSVVAALRAKKQLEPNSLYVYEYLVNKSDSHSDTEVQKYLFLVA